MLAGPIQPLARWLRVHAPARLRIFTGQSQACNVYEQSYAAEVSIRYEHLIFPSQHPCAVTQHNSRWQWAMTPDGRHACATRISEPHSWKTRSQTQSSPGQRKDCPAATTMKHTVLTALATSPRHDKFAPRDRANTDGARSCQAVGTGRECTVLFDVHDASYQIETLLHRPAARGCISGRRRLQP